MELIIILIFIFFGGFIFNAVIAGGKSVITGESFSESMRGMSDFKIRLKDTRIDSVDGEIKEVQMKGLIPVSRPMNISFVVLLSDVTDADNPFPIISLHDSFQAEESVVFCHSAEIGRIEPEQGFTDWIKVSCIFPPLIQTPYSGRREIEVQVLLFNQDNKPNFKSGILLSQSGLICADIIKFSTNITEAGYKEKNENKKEAQSLSIQVAMGLAFSDGSFDSTESKVIKEWAKRNIDSYPESDQAEIKASFNKAFTESFNKGKNGLIDLSAVTARLSKIGDKKSKYDALELCHAVMGADGEIAATEMQFINKIAKELDISSETLNRMKDSVIVNIGSSINDSTSVEVMLGIDSSWDDDKIKVHLRKEFQKWNNRLNTLPAGKERDNAQAILDNIAEARKKYS
ncbi:tellurite resistance TerB family protein [Akkermansiaceae bacterium]|nr:tellurite resistance TerB family protein [Akkermansiaceae bacterium]MDB4277267.1 tellurite resistance TerB family protein [bacterium]MDB4265904.1 tellurite resistance TerB family protein [Akkermansiaceae bacterium]MDB4282739.1 tellurite resistance TerB family protein [Akkermansiaceae bacterium]MDB4307618.1 tellurite resistance TerB family protein [Akkermansiaceae bacterium]